jgi:hypothetical protein
MEKRKGRQKEKKNTKALITSFVETFFKSENMKKAFFILIDLIYSAFDAETLCKKFKFRCCSKNHSDECCHKWVELRDYFTNLYFPELELQRSPLLIYSNNESNLAMGTDDIDEMIEI